MTCPFCGSEDVDVPTVDIGVGEEQCGPASCNDCHAYQDIDGRWHPDESWEDTREEKRGER